MPIGKNSKENTGIRTSDKQEKAFKMHTFAVHPLHGSNGKTERVMII
jgi:hypothetical protein